MRQIIKNGTIVTGGGSFPADILIDGEKIAATGTAEEIGKLTQPGDREIDAAGCLIFPGFIDAHTHFDLHVAGTITADDFATGTKAALRGGTTTIIDFGTQYPGETLAEGLKNWHEKADGKCSCDYSFHMSITDWNPSVSKEVQDALLHNAQTHPQSAALFPPGSYHLLKYSRTAEAHQYWSFG